MKRTKERKIAFEIIFTLPFNDAQAEDLLNNYIKANDNIELTDYICNTVCGIVANLSDIDSKIKNSIIRRKFERLDNVCLAAMRLAVYEMIYNDDVPVNVAVNEAIELTKLYDDSLASFVHANLAIIAKELS